MDRNRDPKSNRKISSSSSDRIAIPKSRRQTAPVSEREMDYTNNPLFARYWAMENAVQSWLRNYREYFQNGFRKPMPPPPPPPLPPALLSRALIRKSTKRSKKQKMNNEEATSASPKLREVTEEWQSVVSISSGVRPEDAEKTEEKMELSDDVLAFMAQTIRHRIEREKKKAYEQEIQDRTVVFVPADRPFMASRFNEFGGDASAVADMLLGRGSTETKMTAAERKRQEMIKLYGDEMAGRIQAEETLMQMRFDQEYDKHHPPFWPNIPLKL